MARRYKLGNKIVPIFIGIIFLYLGFITIRAVKQSFVFSKRDRINIVFYDTQATILSLGLSDKVNYSLSFDNDVSVITPGGYGRYRIGSLGELSAIEKKPKIVQNAFSSTVSTAIDYYFISKKNVLYDKRDINAPIRLPKLSLITAVLTSDITTNANIVDRLYLFLLVAAKRRSDFIPLKTRFVKQDSQGTIFSEEQFSRRYQGFFYEKFIRREEKSIKIGYTSYKSAQNISRVIEGEGIRVADLTKLDSPFSKCRIIESAQKQSQTALFLSRLLECHPQRGEVSGADILVILGKKLEGEWE